MRYVAIGIFIFFALVFVTPTLMEFGKRVKTYFKKAK